MVSGSVTSDTAYRRLLATDWLETYALFEYERERPVRLFGRGRHVRELVALSYKLQAQGERLEWASAGSTRGKLGVLSTGHCREHPSLERMFTGLISAPTVSDEARALAARFRPVMPLVRARVELGDAGTLVDELEDVVLALAADASLAGPQYDEQPLRRQLLDFLPAERRPVVSTLDELWRVGPPMTFTCSRHSEWASEPGQYRPVVRLHDVVVAPRLRRMGLATAALIELTNYADQHGLSITADYIPDLDDVAFARWYYQHGFRQGNRQPEHWLRAGEMRREPRQNHDATTLDAIG